jgi:hypothetical protein
MIFLNIFGFPLVCWTASKSEDSEAAAHEDEHEKDNGLNEDGGNEARNHVLESGFESAFNSGHFRILSVFALNLPANGRCPSSEHLALMAA